MSLRIVANYPATDGSAPESIEIEWSDETPPVQDVQTVIGALAMVPNASITQVVMDQAEFDRAVESAAER